MNSLKTLVVFAMLVRKVWRYQRVTGSRKVRLYNSQQTIYIKIYTEK